MSGGGDSKDGFVKENKKFYNMGQKTNVQNSSLGRSLAHWFVALRTVSKIGLNIPLFVACK